MDFASNTKEDMKKMFEKIGASNFDELIENISKDIQLTEPLDLPEPLSEYEVIKQIRKYSEENINSSTHVCFMGGGAYDHFIPAIVGDIIGRPEFRTAYTPYQAEVSQGTLQSMYEYQSMICALTQMDVANASLYDGASALAEACIMANNVNKKSKFFIAGALNPRYKDVLETICRGKKFEFISFEAEDGSCDIDALKKAIDNKTSAVIVQHPNAYGFLEDVDTISEIAHANKALLISSFDPISLGILKAPGEYDADIATAEGQPLGIPLSFGGPYLGVFAAKKKYVRKIPGRISGATKDVDGNRGYVLTLQTREQQIKRERATSNICTNQGLMMLAAAVYMSVMGKEGVKEVAEHCFQKARYLASKIKQIPGYSLLSDKPFFKEFLVKPPAPSSKIIDEAEKEGVLPGIDTSRFENCKDGLLVAVTEKRTKEEIDKLVEIFKKFSE